MQGKVSWIFDTEYFLQILVLVNFSSLFDHFIVEYFIVGKYSQLDFIVGKYLDIQSTRKHLDLSYNFKYSNENEESTDPFHFYTGFVTTLNTFQDCFLFHSFLVHT